MMTSIHEQSRIEELLTQAHLVCQQGQLAQAQRHCLEILEILPDHVDALTLLGVIALYEQNLLRAVEWFDRVIAISPYNAVIHFRRGVALQVLVRLEEAISSYDKAIGVKPDHAEAWSNRGLALHGLKRFDDALASYGKAIAINQEYAEAYYNLGFTLQELTRPEEAISCYDKATTIKPDYAEAWSNRGLALQELKRFEAALASYDKALEIRHEYAEAWYNRGNVLKELRHSAMALASYDRAITIRPDYAEAYLNRGNVFLDIGQFEDALINYNRAIGINPHYASAYSNRGAALKELRRFEAALASYGQALSINPEGEFWLVAYFHIKMVICDWSSFGELSDQLAINIMQEERACNPFPVLALTDSPVMIQQAASNYVGNRHAEPPQGYENIQRERRGKIRIGYYSADFHNHATAQLMVELFEMHDRSRFEIIAFSFGPDPQNDDMRKRLLLAFDRFIDVRAISDRDVASLSRELEIDIAVDLKGFTKDARTDIFAFRAAPVQVNYLGYPGTMVAEYIDYLIADHTLIPERLQPYYTEKIAYLPDTYQVNDAKRRIADKIFSREDMGLPQTGFVFCCFNNNYKITPETFDCWMRILKSIEGSVLWLFEDSPQASANLHREAVRRGVDPGRLVFAQRMALPEHLARHRLADLFLDTLPYNAHTTASDALWAGLPVLTCMGESFAGRVAASLLNAIELPELITLSQEGYEALAIELATDQDKLAGIRRKLEKNRLSTPLFDIGRFTRHIEAAYTEMYERHRLNLAPDHIYIRPS
ncbi:MAG: tetratricopeptide repeat protein [Chlorobiaceae bacterium]|nr:tetratricopeptide repeat protein [Chlorobiaceae bacterium]